MQNHLTKIILTVTILMSGVMHWPHFSKDLISVHVWRQTQTQSTTISFYEEDMNIFNPRKNDRGNTDGIFRMEFPLFQWLNAVLFKIFGNDILVTRLFLFLISIFSILGMFNLLKEIFKNETIGLVGAWAFTFSPSYFYHSINPMPDNLALCLALWGLYFFFRWTKSKVNQKLLFSGLLLAFSALCKLPFIIFFIVPFIYFIQNFEGFKLKALIKYFLIFSWAILPLAWYAYVIPTWEQNPVLTDIAGTGKTTSKYFGYLFDNVFSTLPELLLNYAAVPFFLISFYFLIKKKGYKNPYFWPLAGLLICLSAFILLELNAIKNYHDYYLFPFFPLLFMMVGYGAYPLLKNKKTKSVVFVILLLIPVACFLRIKGRWNEDATGFNKDLLVYKEELRALVPKDALVVAGNDVSPFIMLYYIDKKGWKFKDDYLSPESLENYIDKGAEYFYSDSEEVNNNPEISPYLGKEIAQIGSIHVFRLKNN